VTSLTDESVSSRSKFNSRFASGASVSGLTAISLSIVLSVIGFTLSYFFILEKNGFLFMINLIF
jgi:hypothetical protein